MIATDQLIAQAVSAQALAAPEWFVSYHDAATYEIGLGLLPLLEASGVGITYVMAQAGTTPGKAYVHGKVRGERDQVVACCRRALADTTPEDEGAHITLYPVV